MAKRPVYLPVTGKSHLPGALEQEVAFTWFSGLSTSQKQKSILSLHDHIKRNSLAANPLEISSKSHQMLGVSLSAFNLMMTVPGSPSDVASVETIYQSSKVFGGNPRTDEDRYLLSPRDARQRAQQLGGNVPFTGWSLDGNDVHLETRTSFYDWLYLRALGENLHLQRCITEYDCFTDIEFNPKKSLACQARSAAIGVSAKWLLGDISIYEESLFKLVSSSQLHGQPATVQHGLPGIGS